MQTLIATCTRMDIKNIKTSKTKLIKSQMEDIKQLCSTLRLRSCMSPLSVRPSLWYRMQVSNACKMVLGPGSAQREAILASLWGS